MTFNSPKKLTRIQKIAKVVIDEFWNNPEKLYTEVRLETLLQFYRVTRMECESILKFLESADYIEEVKLVEAAHKNYLTERIPVYKLVREVTVC